MTHTAGRPGGESDSDPDDYYGYFDEPVSWICIYLDFFSFFSVIDLHQQNELVWENQ